MRSWATYFQPSVRCELGAGKQWASQDIYRGGDWWSTVSSYQGVEGVSLIHKYHVLFVRWSTGNQKFQASFSAWTLLSTRTFRTRSLVLLPILRISKCTRLLVKGLLMSSRNKSARWPLINWSYVMMIKIVKEPPCLGNWWARSLYWVHG